MRTYFLIWIFCYITPVLAQDPSSVSSTNAAYDGQALILTGHVILNHGLGTMTAEEATLQKQENHNTSFPFTHIQLQHDVLLALKNSAELRCQHADLDFIRLKGHFNTIDGQKVVYTDTIKHNKNTLPLQLLSHLLEVNFLQQNLDDHQTEYAIDTLLAHEDVEVHYATHFHLHADNAQYHNTASLKTIKAYPDTPDRKCQLTHDQDLINADQIEIDLIQETLLLQKPKGTLSSPLQQGNLHFHSNQLLWNQRNQQLILTGDVHIHDSGMETIQAQDTITITHELINHKKIVNQIDTQGPTTLSYHDIDQQIINQILCHGHIHLDKTQLEATLDSPQIDGTVPQHLQLHYQDNELSLFANHAILEYTLHNNLFQPISLSLKGNIRFTSLDSNSPPRYGLADRLHYSLTTRTLILSATPGKKVLFFDASQGAKISANEVHIIQDPITDEQTIKGVGNVRFAFSAEENTLLQNLFPQLKSSHE